MSDRLRRDLVALVPRLRRFAYALTGSRQGGDDLVQAACETALRVPGQFGDGVRMDALLYQLIHRRWIANAGRSEYRGAETVTGAPAPGEPSGLPWDRTLMARTRAAMESLPEAQRSVLALVAIEGLSYRETAEIVDLPVGVVVTCLAQARGAVVPRLCPSQGPRR